MVSINRPVAAAMMLIIAAAILFSGKPSSAGGHDTLTLAAELLIVRDDLNRLENQNDLPAPHQRGLRDRISGSLGLLPWLLKQADDTFQLMTNITQRPVLIKQLDQLIARYPLDLDMFSGNNVTAAGRREARNIHLAYCAGCHDGAGQGDPNEALPARDLYEMARNGTSEVFLARLINGIKGDETLLFRNPLTPVQLSALLALYQKNR